jgi:hypothetical protein
MLFDFVPPGNSVIMSPRLLPVMVMLDRAAPELDTGLPAAETSVGLIAGIIAFVLGMCWRITTPRSALPPASAVEPIGTVLR